MPKYVLSDGITPLDQLSDKEIKNVLEKCGIFQEKFSAKEFGYKDRWKLFDILQTLSSDGDGEIMKPEVALEMCDYFTQEPRIIDIDYATFELFWNKAIELKETKKIPAENEMGFRFYVGRNTSNEYGVVIVPMHGPKPAPGQPRNRENEKESAFFTDSPPYQFFALLASKDVKKVSTLQSECKAVIRYKDNIGKEIVCYTEEAFATFKNGLVTKPYSKMRICFARTARAGFVTIILMFLDSNNQPIESVGTFLGRSAQGIFFDQGDLIPPPPQSGISDSSF